MSKFISHAEAADKIEEMYCKGLTFYVYGLIDSKEKSLFYVGKGTGYRALTHIHKADISYYNLSKHNKIKSLKRKNIPVKYFFFGFYKSEEKAFEREKFLILKYGRKTYDEQGILYNTSLGGGYSNFKWNTHSIRKFLESKVSLVERYDFSDIVLKPGLLISNIKHRYCGKHFDCSKGNLLKLKTCPHCQGVSENGHKLKASKESLYGKALMNCSEHGFILKSNIDEFDNTLLDINKKRIICKECGKLHYVNTRHVVDYTLNCYVCRFFRAEPEEALVKMKERCNYFWSIGSFTLININYDGSNRKLLEIDCPVHGIQNIPTDWIAKGKACPMCFKLHGYGSSGNGYHKDYIEEETGSLF